MNQTSRHTSRFVKPFDWWILPPPQFASHYQAFPNANARLEEATRFWGGFVRSSDHECVDEWRVVGVDRKTGDVAGYSLHMSVGGDYRLKTL